MTDWVQESIERKEIPKGFQANYRKALTGRGYKAGVTAFCQECQGFDDKVPEAIAGCLVEDCPLWRCRPYQNRRRFSK